MSAGSASLSINLKRSSMVALLHCGASLEISNFESPQFAPGKGPQTISIVIFANGQNGVAASTCSGSHQVEGGSGRR
jgi:hypothetical protein